MPNFYHPVNGPKKTCAMCIFMQKLSFGEVFPRYLEQMVGHVDAEIEQQDPEDAIGAPALRLLILGNLQLRHQA